MHIHIHASHMPLRPEVREYIERRLAFALQRQRLRIRHIAVHLADANGPRGGVDKLCQVRVQTEHSGQTIITERDSRLLTLIDRAADRAAHATNRRCHRRPSPARRVLGAAA
jgi:putative sigma-54 modulation protein